MECNREDEQLM